VPVEQALKIDSTTIVAATHLAPLDAYRAQNEASTHCGKGAVTSNCLCAVDSMHKLGQANRREHCPLITCCGNDLLEHLLYVVASALSSGDHAGVEDQSHAGGSAVHDGY
jgi:hypothetical protein